MKIPKFLKQISRRERARIEFHRQRGNYLFYTDPSFLTGYVLSYVKTKKIPPELLELQNLQIFLLITNLGIYEIQKRVINKLGLSKEESYNTCLEFFSQLPILIFSQPVLNLDNHFENWLDIDLPDGIHIEAAKVFNIPIVTSEERKLTKWKEKYDQVVSNKEFWNFARELKTKLEKKD